MTRFPMTEEIRMSNDELAGLVRVQTNRPCEPKPHDSGYSPFGFRNSSFLRHWVIRASSFILFILSCSACSAQDSADYRFWTTKNGRKSDIKLAIVESSTEIVKLKRQDNGKVIELRVDQLSDTDQQHLRQRREAGSPSVNSGSDSADDWTRFRGPGGSCVSADKNIPIEWSATKNLAWKLELPGPGASGPVTWRDRVYATCYTGYGIDADTPGDMENLERHLLCVRRSDGELLWKATMKSKAAVHPSQGSLLEHGYATHTPTVDSAGVYVFYGSSGAASYTHAGEPRWQTSCGTDVHGYGSASSPILSDNVLIVSTQVESQSIIGLDTRNGRELWRAEAFRHVWGTPIIVRHDDKAELVCFLDKRSVVGLNPANGRKLWNYQTSTSDVQRVTSGPVRYKDAIITMQGGYGANSFRFGGTGDVTDSHQQWNSPGIYGSPLIFQDQLVAPFRGAVRFCDAKNGPGRDQYLRLNPSKDGYASSVIADDKLYRIYKEDGVCVVQLGQEPKQIAHNVLEGDTSFFNATPAISKGQLFLRSNNYLYCIQK